MSHGNLPEYGNDVKISNKSSSVTRSRCSEMSDQWRVSLCINRMSENGMYHLGERDFIMFDEIPVSTIELPNGRFQTFPDILSIEISREECSRQRLAHNTDAEEMEDQVTMEQQQNGRG